MLKKIKYKEDFRRLSKPIVRPEKFELVVVHTLGRGFEKEARKILRPGGGQKVLVDFRRPQMGGGLDDYGFDLPGAYVAAGLLVIFVQGFVQELGKQSAKTLWDKGMRLAEKAESSATLELRIGEKRMRITVPRKLSKSDQQKLMKLVTAEWPKVRGRAEYIFDAKHKFLTKLPD